MGHFEMVLCEKTLLEEIASGATQKHVAMTYLLAMKSSETVDWRKVNEAIINRWSRAGLERVKRMAWKIGE